jgi:hypothetical protein
MKKNVLFLCVCLMSNICFAQLDFKSTNSGRTIDLADLDGHSLLKQYDPDVNGSPFINSDWVPAIITLSKGKNIGPISVKLNIESNELYFRDSSGKEMIATEGLVKKIDFLTFYSKDDIRYVFKNGYPVIDKQNENYYYQVYTEGKIELLTKKIRYIRATKNDISGERSSEFIDGADILYVYVNNSMQVFHSHKTFVLSLLKDKEEAIKSFVNTNKINFKKKLDLIKLFNYYNSLYK